MKGGLLGFAGSGKRTAFNTLTGLNAPGGFGGEVRFGAVKVPDERIDALRKIFKPKKTTYAEIIAPGRRCLIIVDLRASPAGRAVGTTTRWLWRPRAGWPRSPAVRRSERRTPPTCKRPGPEPAGASSVA